MHVAMPKRKPKPSDTPKSTQIGVKLPPKLSDALASYLDDQRPKTSAPEVIRVALEDWLAAKGYWSEDSEDGE